MIIHLSKEFYSVSDDSLNPSCHADSAGSASRVQVQLEGADCRDCWMAVFPSAVMLLPLDFSWAGLSCRIQAQVKRIYVLGALGQGRAHVL